MGGTTRTEGLVDIQICHPKKMRLKRIKTCFSMRILLLNNNSDIKNLSTTLIDIFTKSKIF
ncbi:hypothetical protein ACOAJ8_01175 [Arcobacter cryaerophilus gv. pseudocryaerophilus]